MISPLELKNIIEGSERVKKAIDNNEKITIFADPDVDGLCSSYIMYDYLKYRLKHPYVVLTWPERSQGHGLNMAYDKVHKTTDLLIAIDSSTSDRKACELLSKDMDIIIIDHHNPENDNEFALIVNPQLQENYENLSSCGTLLSFKFVELLDYHYRKVNIKDYMDVVGMATMSDQMRLDNMENRYYVYHGMKRINNIGLLALLHASRNTDTERLNSQTFHFDVIPVFNTVARNDELFRGFKLLFEKDFFKAKELASELLIQNKARKEKVKRLVEEYMEIIQDEKIAYVVTKNAEKGFNGLVASKLTDILKKPCLVLKDSGEYYQGSGRTYGDFKMQSFLKGCNLIEYAAGHEEAFGFSIKAEHWNKFKRYVNDNIDEKLFDPVIEYDLELTENQLTWDLVNEIESFNEIWGNGNPPIKVRVNNVFVEDRELFPQKNPEHVKIKTSNVDMLYFNDSQYAKNISAWDYISAVGSLSINDFKKDNKRIQLFIEDYRKK